MRAALRSFGAAVRERNRRLAENLDDPFDISAGMAINDTGWNAFFGSLREQEAAANAAGLNFRADLGGIGRFDVPPMGGGRLTQTDRDTIAGNAFLGRVNDDRVFQDINKRVGLSAAQQAETAARGMQQEEQDRMDIDRAAAVAQLETRDPEAQKQAFLSKIPAHLRPFYEQQMVNRLMGERKMAVEEGKLAVDAMRAQNASEGAPVAVMGPDGKSVLVRPRDAYGQTPAQSRERTTEDERKSVGWYAQMQDAAKTIDALEDKLTDTEIYQMQTLPHDELIGMANRNLLSETAKRYLRAFTQFSEARLRSVSGAAISSGEYQADRQTYGRQYGETPTLAEDRRRARGVVIQSTKDRAGVAMPREAGGGGDELIYAVDPEGNIHSAKKGATLPPGWRSSQAPGGRQ